MTEEFFELGGPRDMFEKAKREFGRMKSSPNIDTVFNFFVTAYHVKDYVIARHEALRDAIEEGFGKDQHFRMCDYICQKGKHLKLRAKQWRDNPFEPRRKYGAALGKAALGKAHLNRSDGYFLVANGVEIDVIELGQRVLEKWEHFFSDNGI